MHHQKILEFLRLLRLFGEADLHVELDPIPVSSRRGPNCAPLRLLTQHLQ